MAETVVIYHSGYGHTARVAEFVAQGAKAQTIVISPEGDISDAARHDLGWSASAERWHA